MVEAAVDDLVGVELLSLKDSTFRGGGGDYE